MAVGCRCVDAEWDVETSEAAAVGFGLQSALEMGLWRLEVGPAFIFEFCLF